VARSKLLGRLSKWFFEASVEASLRRFELRATLMTANGPLTDTVTLEVFEPPKSSGFGKVPPSSEGNSVAEAHLRGTTRRKPEGL
jgi:hypothetical protein